MYYFSKIYTGLRIYLTISLLSFIVNEHVFSAEKIDWKDKELKTGNRLAVLDFSAKGISDPMRDILTEQFRQNIKKLKIYEVLDASMTKRSLKSLKVESFINKIFLGSQNMKKLFKMLKIHW